ncbi:hypothetical protein SAMD00023353_4900880 [Rosellinia necatrix]|uniref:Uncharacterized protein n=1 Tax=Rosellinia necatrix TaxID=77044 RepID=A0A1W2TPL7_ROSNE|nr:hypothetical protein SAMD00023353_4900880 [Rosellinia necatrix]
MEHFRVELLENEKQRRDEIIAAANNHKAGMGDRLLIRLNNGEWAAFCAKMALKDERFRKYPLLSADYQYWLEDLHSWLAVFKTRDGFTWPEPKTTGAPYSRPFLEAFYRETKAEKEERERNQARYAAHFPDAAAPGDLHQAGVAEEAVTDQDIRMPARWDDNGTLLPVEHSTMDDCVEVWKGLFSPNIWPKDCVPFEVPVPEHMDPQAVLAPLDDLDELMFELWRRFSPASPWCVRFFTRCRRDPSSRFGVRVWVFIDWPAGQNLQNVSWRRHLYYATMCLMTWHHRLLRGEQVHILESVDAQSELEFQQHQTLFRNIGIRLRAIAEYQQQSVGSAEGDAAVTQALYDKQQRTITSLALGGVDHHMSSTSDPIKRLGLLVQVIDRGMEPLPLTLDGRRLAVASAAKTVLADVARALLGTSDSAQTKMRNIGQLLRVDPDDDWEKVLPVGSRFRAIRGLVQRYAIDSGDRSRVEKCLMIWSAVKDVCEHSDGMDIATQSQQTHLDSVEALL